jgi:hypothetical protein
MENQIYSWKTKEFEHYEKGAGWYLTLGIVGFFVIVYEIYLHDYFAAITLFIVLGAVYFFSRLLPRDITVTITNKAVHLDTLSYPYTQIKRFWVVTKGTTNKLHFETTAYLNRYIVLLLDGQNPETISDILKEFLPESEENQETLAQKAARKLRF